MIDKKPRPNERLSRIANPTYIIYASPLPNSERMGAVVDFLFGRPIFNAKQLTEGVDMPFKTARQYIEKLVQAGIVHEVTGYARNQIYRADEIFKALDSIEG